MLALLLSGGIPKGDTPPFGRVFGDFLRVQKVTRLSGQDPADFALQGFGGGTPEESKKPRRTFHRPARFHMLGKVPSQAVCPRAGLSPGRMGSALSRRVPST